VAINPSASYLKQKKTLLPILRKVQVVIMNREEAAYLTGIPYEKETEIFAALDKLVPGVAVMTEGEYGAVASDGKNIYRVAPAPAQAVDQTGAGDAFGSAFLAALLRRGACIHEGKLCVDAEDVVYALQCAALNSASVVSEIGAEKSILHSYAPSKLSKIRVSTKKITG
jgi:sugar/nucleoside kinase (ribokinase family)